MGNSDQVNTRRDSDGATKAVPGDLFVLSPIVSDSVSEGVVTRGGLDLIG